MQRRHDIFTPTVDRQRFSAAMRYAPAVSTAEQLYGNDAPQRAITMMNRERRQRQLQEHARRVEQLLFLPSLNRPLREIQTRKDPERFQKLQKRKHQELFAEALKLFAVLVKKPELFQTLTNNETALTTRSFAAPNIQTKIDALLEAAQKAPKPAAPTMKVDSTEQATAATFRRLQQKLEEEETKRRKERNKKKDFDGLLK